MKRSATFPAAGPRRGTLDRFLRGDGPRDGPLTLDRSRIFVLPTRLGLWFGLLLVVMLLGAVNYANNLGMLFVFFLGSAAVVSILHTYHVLGRLEFRPGRTPPAFAGGSAGYRLVVRNPGAMSRRGVEFRSVREDAGSVCTDLPPGDGEVVLSCPARRRGRSPLGRVTVSSRHPLGLFRAWAHLEFRELECLVYPRPAPPGPWPAGAAVTGLDVGGGRGGEDDLAGLRPYAPGDPLRQVHWKATAKRDRLVVMERAGGAHAELWLAWDQWPGLGTEERLSRLCRGVLDAHAAALSWGLRLPGVELPPARGPEHRERCLAALAEFGG
ncbi:MAG: DUF58 domain-containing protein [Deferrisomatales bacterium]|nr:DUF58 domain-containing protein [Deferrisomatales bacterium]